MENREYIQKTGSKMQSVLMEYQNDLDTCVCDIHKDVLNKFCEFPRREQFQLSTHVMQSMLFYEVCRVIAPFGNIKDWKNVFRDMEDQCVDVCSDLYFGMRQS